MSRSIRTAACCALTAALAACANLPPAPPPELAAPPSHQVPAPRPVPAQPTPAQPSPRPAQHPAPASAPTPAPAPVQPSPSRERMQQVEQRIDQLHHRIDANVAAGHIQAPDADALHHRLDVIHQEATDMAAPHNNGLSSDEQHVLSQELDTAAYAIGQ